MLECSLHNPESFKFQPERMIYDTVVGGRTLKRALPVVIGILTDIPELPEQNEFTHVEDAPHPSLDKYLQGIELGPDMQVKYMNVSPGHLDTADMQRHLYDIIHEELMLFGGMPYSCIIADYKALPKSLIDDLTNITSSAYAPLIINFEPNSLTAMTEEIAAAREVQRLQVMQRDCYH
ncbi:MAG: type VI secretion system contractile sheath domain-containing protein [Alphaproteobacteria bacterium]